MNRRDEFHRAEWKAVASPDVHRVASGSLADAELHQLVGGNDDGAVAPGQGDRIAKMIAVPVAHENRIELRSTRWAPPAPI